MTKRQVSEEELCHDRLGDRFADALSNYDTQRRVEVLVDEFLGEEKLRGKETLEVGCGLGFFSERAHSIGAKLLATDLGPNLVERTRERVGCETEIADALRLRDHFGDRRFDVVLSSECIEHTPDPSRALKEMCAVLKPGGWLSISTPNVLWYPVVRAATILKLRPFDGHENFSSWAGLRKELDACDMDVFEERGLHLFPFQLPGKALSRWCDANLQPLRGCMINICILARKRGA